MLVCFVLQLNAQTNPSPHTKCLSDQYHEQLMSDPHYAKQWQKERKAILESAEYASRGPGACATPLIIPVAVHYNSPVTNANLQCLYDAAEAQIEQLNLDYSSCNANAGELCNWINAGCTNFGGTAGADAMPEDGSCIQFVLACGAALPESEVSDAGVAYAITVGDYTWPNVPGTTWDGYLNIFVSDGTTAGVGGGVLGVAPLGGASNPNGNGVFVDAGSFGSQTFAGCTSGGSIDMAAPYDGGATLTHEVGHYFGLDHTFSDNLADTPAQTTENFGCPTVDLVNCTSSVGDDYSGNFMDYVDDDCMHNFSADQVALMCATAADQTSWASTGDCTAPAYASCQGACVVVLAVCPEASDLLLDNLLDGDMVCDNSGQIAIAAVENVNLYLPGFEISWSSGVWGGEISADITDGCDAGVLALPQGSFGDVVAVSAGGNQDLTYWTPGGTGPTIVLSDLAAPGDSELNDFTIVDRLCGDIIFGGTGTTITFDAAGVMVGGPIALPALTGGVTMSGPGITEDGCAQGFAIFDPVAAGAGVHQICVDYTGVSCTSATNDCPAVQNCISVTVLASPVFDFASFDIMCNGATYDVSIPLDYNPAGGPFVVTATGGVLSPAVLSGSGSDVLMVTGIPSGTAFTIDVDDTSGSNCDTAVGSTFTCLDCSADVIADITPGREFCSTDAVVPLTPPKTPAIIPVSLTVTVLDGGDFPTEHVAAILPDNAGAPDFTAPIWELNAGDAALIDAFAVLCDGAGDTAGAGIISANASTIAIPTGGSFYIALVDDWGDGWGATASFTFADQCGTVYADQTALDNGCGSIFGPFNADLLQSGIFTGNGVELVSDPDGTLGNGDESWQFNPATATVSDAVCTTEDIVYEFFDECGNFCDVRVTPIIYSAPQGVDVAKTIADCDASGNVTFSVADMGITGGNATYLMTYSYTDAAGVLQTLTDVAIADIVVQGGGANASITVTISNDPTAYTAPCDGNACISTIVLTSVSCCSVTDPTGVTITDSQCQADNVTVSGGSFDGTAAACVTGVLTYYTDATMTTSMVAPTYSQTGPAQTLFMTCFDAATNCESDLITVGPTVPGQCSAIVVAQDFALSDPCDCNDDQSANGAMDGTFNETIVVNTNPVATGLSLCVANGGTGDAPAAGTPLVDNGDGTYSLTFTHTDAIGYSLTVAECVDLDTPITGSIDNVCFYPIIELPLTDACSNATPIDLTTLAVETTGMAFDGVFSFSGTGVTGNIFDPAAAGIGIHTITVDYVPTSVAGTNPGTVATCTTDIMIQVSVIDCTVCNADNGTLSIKVIPTDN